MDLQSWEADLRKTLEACALAIEVSPKTMLMIFVDPKDHQIVEVIAKAMAIGSWMLMDRESTCTTSVIRDPSLPVIVLLVPTAPRP